MATNYTSLAKKNTQYDKLSKQGYSDFKISTMGSTTPDGIPAPKQQKFPSLNNRPIIKFDQGAFDTKPVAQQDIKFGGSGSTGTATSKTQTIGGTSASIQSQKLPMAQRTQPSGPAGLKVGESMTVEPDYEYEFKYGKNPKHTAKGLYNPDYIPESEDEIYGMTDLTPLARNRWLANYNKATKGIDFNAEDYPFSYDEEAEQFLGQQEENRSRLERDIDQAKKEGKRKLGEDTSAIISEFAVNREGVQSGSNIVARDKMKGRMEERYGTEMQRLEDMMRDLDRLEQRQSREFVSGMDEQILAKREAIAAQQAKLGEQAAERRAESLQIVEMLQEDNALGMLSEEDLNYLADGMEGLPSGLLQTLAYASQRDIAVEMEEKQYQRGLDSFDQSSSILKLMESSGALADLDAESIAFIEAGMPGVPSGVVEAISRSATRTMLNDEQKQEFDQMTEMYDIAESFSKLKGTIYLPTEDGGFQDSGIPTVDLMKFESVEARDLMRIQLLSDTLRTTKARDLIKNFGSGASPFVEQLLGLSRGSLAGLTTEAELNRAFDYAVEDAKMQKVLIEEGLWNQGQADLTAYHDQSAAIKKGGVSNPFAFADVKDFVLSGSNITQGYNPKGGTDKGGGHAGIDYVTKDGQVRAARGGIVVAINEDTGPNGWGGQVQVMDADGYVWQYSHMGWKGETGEVDPFSVQEGDYINKNDILGAQGNTGHVISRYTGPQAGAHVDLRMVGQLDPTSIMEQVKEPKRGGEGGDGGSTIEAFENYFLRPPNDNERKMINKYGTGYLNAVIAADEEEEAEEVKVAGEKSFRAEQSAAKAEEKEAEKARTEAELSVPEPLQVQFEKYYGKSPSKDQRKMMNKYGQDWLDNEIAKDKDKKEEKADVTSDTVIETTSRRRFNELTDASPFSSRRGSISGESVDREVTYGDLEDAYVKKFKKLPTSADKKMLIKRGLIGLDEIFSREAAKSKPKSTSKSTSKAVELNIK